MKIDLVVRGTCAVRPGVPGLSENIRVRSVLGRFLEHSRIYAFAGEGEPIVYIGSADLMHRNLDRRIEALITIVHPEQRAALIENIDLAMSDEFSAWTLQEDGAWLRRVVNKKGERLLDLQAMYIQRQPERRAPNRNAAT